MDITFSVQSGTKQDLDPSDQISAPPKHHTLDPKPITLNPKPTTLNPKPLLASVRALGILKSFKIQHPESLSHEPKNVGALIIALIIRVYGLGFP